MSYKFVFSLLLLTSFQQTSSSQNQSEGECPQDLCLAVTITCITGACTAACAYTLYEGKHRPESAFGMLFCSLATLVGCEKVAEFHNKLQKRTKKRSYAVQTYGIPDDYTELDTDLYNTKANLQATEDLMRQEQRKLEELMCSNTQKTTHNLAGKGVGGSDAISAIRQRKAHVLHEMNTTKQVIQENIDQLRKNIDQRAAMK